MKIDSFLGEPQIQLCQVNWKHVFITKSEVIIIRAEILVIVKNRAAPVSMC